MVRPSAPLPRPRSRRVAGSPAHSARSAYRPGPLPLPYMSAHDNAALDRALGADMRSEQPLRSVESMHDNARYHVPTVSANRRISILSDYAASIVRGLFALAIVATLSLATGYLVYQLGTLATLPGGGR